MRNGTNVETACQQSRPRELLVISQSKITLETSYTSFSPTCTRLAFFPEKVKYTKCFLPPYICKFRSPWVKTTAMSPGRAAQKLTFDHVSPISLTRPLFLQSVWDQFDGKCVQIFNKGAYQRRGRAVILTGAEVGMATTTSQRTKN